MKFEVPRTPRLLYLASLGEPLPLDEGNLFCVQALFKGGYIRAEIIFNQNATQLVCKLTPLGEEFLRWFDD